MNRLDRFFKEEEEEEKIGWAQRTRGIGELPKYELSKLGLEKAKEVEIPPITEPIKTPLGLGVKAGIGIELPKDEPTWGNVVKHSLKAGLGQYQAGLVNIFRLIDMGITKLTDPIQKIIPIDIEKAKKFKEKYGIDPYKINTTEILTKIVKDSEKIAIESREQAESKDWLKKFIGTGVQAVPQVVGAVAMGAGMPVVTGIAAAKPLAEIITRVTQMAPFGVAAAGTHAREIEKEYEELGKEIPYLKVVVGGVLAGAGEMATELPVFMGLATILKSGGKALINEGSKTLLSKYGGLGIEFIKDVALQAWQEAFMVPIEKGIKQAVGLPQDWSVGPLVKEMGEAAYGGLAMAVVLGGLGGSVVGSAKIATKTMEVVDNVIQNKGDIKESFRKIAELQGIMPAEPEAVALAVEPRPPVEPTIPGLNEKEIVPATIEEAKEILKVDPKKPSVPKIKLAEEMVKKKVSLADIEAVKKEKIDVKKP
ncbi:hypothetical protein ES695_04080, partial [Candidatus Atribacteria bacterium 1244-E10-H5-B2]